MRSDLLDQNAHDLLDQNVHHLLDQITRDVSVETFAKFVKKKKKLGFSKEVCNVLYENIYDPEKSLHSVKIPKFMFVVVDPFHSFPFQECF